MASLVGAAEWEVDTDFAMLSATQDEVHDHEPMAFAGSFPGAVHLLCGAKYATVRARAERWDARPPEAGPEWEDADELPWSTVAGAGPLRVAGFDPPEPDAPALDVEGLERARVQVLAAGRYDGDGQTSPEPERWLLRLWPAGDGAPLDPLAGPPRRLAGPLPLAPPPLPAWAEALREWELAGWGSLTEIEAFREIRDALLRAGRPTGVADLAAAFGPLAPLQRERGGPYGWDSPALGHGWATPPEQAFPDRVETLRAVAAAAGLAAVATFGDALEALERLGLVARGAGGGLVPNPAPPASWDVLGLPAERAAAARVQSLRRRYQHLQGDVLRLLAWGPLRATPRRIAVRLALRPEDVVGALRLVAATGDATVAPDPDDLDTAVTVTPGRPLP
ncbi:MAG TPA: hypothetical protein VF519_10315 [Mycobacteriales bacterium]|jgi:hypothetical protein